MNALLETNEYKLTDICFASGFDKKSDDDYRIVYTLYTKNGIKNKEVNFYQKDNKFYLIKNEEAAEILDFIESYINSDEKTWRKPLFSQYSHTFFKKQALAGK